MVGVDLRGLHSAGTLALRLLQRMGVRPPLAQFSDLTDEELAAWTATLHGGLVDAHPTSGLVDAADLDIRFAHGRVAHLLGVWNVLTAEHLRVEDVTDEFRRFLESPDLAEQLLDPATWRRWGLTRAVVRAQGEPLPIEIDTGDRVGRLVLTNVQDERRDVTWCDAATATLLAGHAIDVLEARRLVPEGRQ